MIFKGTFKPALFALACFAFTGCAAVDSALTKVADTITPEDTVTGKRTLNFESEEKEIARAEAQSAQLLKGLREKGVEVDTDRAGVMRLRDMLAELAMVSHRPGLPWEVHLIEHKDVNAFTIGGGKLFVLQGLFTGLVAADDDDELAAVLAHEAAHVTLKHIGKGRAFQLASVAASLASEAAASQVGGRVFQASFTTVQEDEADRVGLLYMALAGYDPGAAKRIWARAHKKYGSDAGNYTYDHSLNKDRLEKIAKLEPVARTYYKGSGIRNPDFERIRADNDLIKRDKDAGKEQSGFSKLVGGIVGTISDLSKVKKEEKKRERMMRDDPRGINRSARVVGLKIAQGPGGYSTVMGRLQNTGTRTIRSAEVKVYYFDAGGEIIHTERLFFRDIILSPRQTNEWRAELRSVPGMKELGAGVTKIYFVR